MLGINELKEYKTLFVDCNINVLKVERDCLKKLIFIYNDVN